MGGASLAASAALAAGGASSLEQAIHTAPPKDAHAIPSRRSMRLLRIRMIVPRLPGLGCDSAPGMLCGRSMHTRVLRVDPARPDPAILAEAARVLRANGLVAFPTETVYGLGGRALSSEAVTRIFEAKGRPRAHPLIAHVTDEGAARALSADWSERASRLARAFWPGPLTLVVPRAAYVPESLVGGGLSVAVRAPAHPIALALLQAVGEPLAAPSANRFQSLSPTRAEHVLRS